MNRRLRPLPIAKAATLFAYGMDTMDIARHLNRTEAEVYNFLSDARRLGLLK
jgi:hypothetical protein